MRQDKWWNVYGPFDPGEDDLPHMGQVLSHYRDLSGMKTAEVWQRLQEMGWDIGERRMEQLLSKNNIAEPQSISRRKFLVKVLAIPPALMGLSYISEFSMTTTNETIHYEMLPQFESTLDSFWNSFYSSSVQRHASGIIQWRNYMEQIGENTSHFQREMKVLLCRFDQLAAVTSRDKADFPSAMYYHNEAVDLAQELDHAELMAASLIRRAKTLILQKKLEKAISDLSRALPYARRSRDNLRGYVFQTTAQVITLLPKQSDSAARFQQFMGEASRILAKGTPQPDGSYTQLSLAGFHQDRARGFLRLGDVQSALDAIDAAEKVHQPDMTRWHAEMLFLRAQAYAQENEIDFACHQIREAMLLVGATQSQMQKKQIEGFYRSLAQEHGSHREVRQLAAMLTN